jgi:hypothetical protein
MLLPNNATSEGTLTPLDSSFVASLLVKLGRAVEQLVEALHYKPEGRWFEFSIDKIHPVALGPWGRLSL